MKQSIIAFISLLLTSSCKKDETPAKGPDCSNKATVYITPEISNFKFQTGTYWVFMDSVSMIMDTIKVISSGGAVHPFQYCPNNYYEFYSFKVNPNDINSVSDQYSLSGNALMRNQRSEHGFDEMIYQDFYPEIDSLFIYDRYYKNVVVHTKTSDLSENGNKTVYYINTTFGFLKKEIFNTNNLLISKKVLKDKLIIR